MIPCVFFQLAVLPWFKARGRSYLSISFKTDHLIIQNKWDEDRLKTHNGFKHISYENVFTHPNLGLYLTTKPSYCSSNSTNSWLQRRDIWDEPLRNAISTNLVVTFS